MIIPLFGTGLQGKSPTVSAQSRVNVIAEMPKDPEKGQIALYGFPGLVEFWDIDAWSTANSVPAGYVPAGPVRAMMGMSGIGGYFGGASPDKHVTYLAVVKGGLLYSQFDSGLRNYNFAYFRSTGIVDDRATRMDAAAVGQVSGLNQMFTADGQSLGHYAYAVESGSFGAGTVTAVSDADAQAWVTCTYLAQRVVTTKSNSNQFYYSSDSYGQTWDALDFQSAESAPGVIRRVYAFGGALIAFGVNTTEFFQVSGDPDIPFAPLRGAALDWGLGAMWSVATCNGSVVFLGRNAQGQHQIVRLAGYTPQVISDQSLDAQINALSDVSDATALSYVIDGHPFYQINFTTANRSYLLDVSNGVWSRLTDENGNRHRAEIAVNFNGQTIVSDYQNGKLYTLSSSAYTNNGAVLPREVVSRHFFANHDRVVVDELVVDFEVGVGDNTTTDPQVMLQISKDNGRSWGTELWMPLGKIGETQKRVVWRRLGLGRDWTFKLRVTDPVKFVISSAAIRATPVG